MGPNKKHVHVSHEKNTSLDPSVKLNLKPLRNERTEVPNKVDRFNRKCTTCKNTGTIEVTMNRKIHLAICPDCNKLPKNLR